MLVWYIDSNELSLLRICRLQLIVYLVIIINYMLFEFVKLFKRNFYFMIGSILLMIGFKVSIIIMLYNVPEEIRSKYWKIIFFLQSQSIIDIIISIVGISLILIVYCFCRTLIINLASVIVEGIVNSIFDSLFNNGEGSIQIKSLIQKLPRSQFDAKIYSKDSECIICMERYSNDCPIIVLPCDKRHFFHEACITDWMRVSMNSTCPFCKSDIKELMSEPNEENKNFVNN